MRASSGCVSPSGPVREIGVKQAQGGHGDGDRLRPGQDVGPWVSRAVAGPGQSCLSAEPSPQVQGPPWARLDLSVASPQHSQECHSGPPGTRPGAGPPGMWVCSGPGRGEDEEPGLVPHITRRRSFPQNKREAYIGYLSAPLGSCYSKLK